MRFGKYPGPIPQGEVMPVVVNFGTVTLLEFWSPDGKGKLMMAGMEIGEVKLFIADLVQALDRAEQVRASLRPIERRRGE